MWALYYLSPLIFAFLDWRTVKFEKRVPNKTLNFWIRAGIGAVFGTFLVLQGYVWYWVVPFILFGFWWPFNLLIGLFLHGDPFRLSKSDSKIDDILKKIPGSWYWLLLLFVITGAIMLFYGGCTYSEINNGYCR
jgi:hypothetical protein